MSGIPDDEYERPWLYRPHTKAYDDLLKEEPRMTSPKTVTPDQHQAVPDLVARLRAQATTSLTQGDPYKALFAEAAEALAARPALPVETPAEGLREASDALAELWTYNYLSERAQALGESHDENEMMESATDIVAGYKKYRPAPAPLSGRDGSLREALKKIAGQKKTDELSTEYEAEIADFETGYDTCIDEARAALAAVPPETAEMEGATPEMALKTGYEFLLKAQADIADARELSVLSEYDGFARNAGVISKGRAKRIAELTDRLAARASSSGEASEAETIGTTYDGVDILAPAVPSKNFTREEARAAIKAVRASSSGEAGDA